MLGLVASGAAPLLRPHSSEWQDEEVACSTSYWRGDRCNQSWAPAASTDRDGAKPVSLCQRQTDSQLWAVGCRGGAAVSSLSPSHG